MPRKGLFGAARERRRIQREIAKQLRSGTYERRAGELTKRARQSRPRPSEPPPTVPPRPPPPSSGGGGGGNPFRSAFNGTVPRRQIRRISDETGFSANEIFQRHVELFYSLPGITEEDRGEQLRLWQVYLDHMVVSAERRNDPANPFWREFGIDPATVAFDWSEWRDAMGYSRRGR